MVNIDILTMASQLHITSGGPKGNCTCSGLGLVKIVDIVIKVIEVKTIVSE